MKQIRCQHPLLLVSLILLLTPVLPSEARSISTYDLAVLEFVDLNGDGAYGLSPSGTEPGMANVEISLYQDLSPLQSFGREDVLLLKARTNPDGYVVFRSLAAGSYLLISPMVSGYLPTTPDEQPFTLEGDGHGTVLEFIFGQLQQSAFKQHWIFPLVGIAPVTRS